MLNCLNPDKGSEWLSYTEGSKQVNATTYFEAAINYDRVFGNHGVSGLLVYNMRNYCREMREVCFFRCLTGIWGYPVVLLIIMIVVISLIFLIGWMDLHPLVLRIVFSILVYRFWVYG